MLRRIGLVAAMLAATALSARADTFNLDRKHSNVGFSVRHFAISKVHGQFGEFSGTIEYDPADTSKWSADIVIQAASIDTRDSSRDDHLRSEDFFDVVKFPTITFKSKKVTSKGNNTFDLLGDLTMHGVTKPVTLNVEMLGMAEGERFGKKIGFTASTRINRMDYGTKYNSMLESGALVVGRDIDITLEVEANLKKQ